MMETDRLKDAILDMDEWYAVYRNDTVSFESMEEQDEASLTLIKLAIDKQIPMKPKIHVGEYEYERWPICLRCESEFIPRGENYCTKCGQAIDWNEEDE